MSKKQEASAPLGAKQFTQRQMLKNINSAFFQYENSFVRNMIPNNIIEIGGNFKLKEGFEYVGYTDNPSFPKKDRSAIMFRKIKDIYGYENMELYRDYWFHVPKTMIKLIKSKQKVI